MKKVLVVGLLILSLSLSLFACGNKPAEDGSNDAASSTTAAATEEA